MSLKKYKEKRKFNDTPEPKGKVVKRQKPLIFVVQKHRATSLHYDLRLELDGVLLSWAVPKGPSLNPNDKRLAMMVEDHPFDYKDFEGIIPKGNYGAGEVIVWDKGTYHSLLSNERPESDKQLKAGLKKGDLKIYLHGEKLNGGYAVVKIGKDDKNTWLLIKKKDEFATVKDITKEEASVITGVTIRDLQKEGVAALKGKKKSPKRKASSLKKKSTVRPKKKAASTKKEFTVKKPLTKKSPKKKA